MDEEACVGERNRVTGSSRSSSRRRDLVLGTIVIGIVWGESQERCTHCYLV